MHNFIHLIIDVAFLQKFIYLVIDSILTIMTLWLWYVVEFVGPIILHLLDLSVSTCISYMCVCVRERERLCHFGLVDS